MPRRNLIIKPELVVLHEGARTQGLPTAIIEDLGRTEFHGTPTPTCVAIGPAEGEKIDRLAGHLKLL